MITVLVRIAASNVDTVTIIHRVITYMEPVWMGVTEGTKAQNACKVCRDYIHIILTYMFYMCWIDIVEQSHKMFTLKLLYQ